MPAKKRKKKKADTLWLHSGTGQWAKKICGRTYYFGTDHDTAMQEYLATKDDIKAGREPRRQARDSTSLRVADIFEIWLEDRYEQLKAERLQPNTMREYQVEDTT